MGIGKDDTLFAKIDGVVRFETKHAGKKQVSVYAEAAGEVSAHATQCGKRANLFLVRSLLRPAVSRAAADCGRQELTKRGEKCYSPLGITEGMPWHRIARIRRRFSSGCACRGGVTAIVGGGGKTTLMERLALELASAGHTVLVTTTTRIFPPEAMPVLISPTPEAISHALCAHAGEPVCVGAPAQQGKLQACGSLPWRRCPGLRRMCSSRPNGGQASAAEGAGSA